MHSSLLKTCLATLVVLLLTTGTTKADPWTNTDTALEAAVLATFAADYLQTRHIVRDGLETNLMMRGHQTASPFLEGPSALMSPEAYFLSVSVLHVVAMRLLPKPWRSVAQGLTIGIQLQAIKHNYAWGYKVRF